MKRVIVGSGINMDAFRSQVRGRSRHQLISLKTELVEQRAKVKAELRAISSTGVLHGEEREYAKNACITERDLLGAKIAYVINLLSRIKQMKKGLLPRACHYCDGTELDPKDCHVCHGRGEKK